MSGAGMSAYHGAARADEDLAAINWSTSAGSADADLLPELATLTLRLDLPALRLDVLTLGLALPLRLRCIGRWSVGSPRRQGRQRCTTHAQEGCGKKAGRQCRHQVSPVSTTRRSSARNSLDCISLRREMVRGNSCARGPSV